MEIRAYCAEDCTFLARLFYNTVHSVNAADYTPAQLDAWAPKVQDMVLWNRLFLASYTLVAHTHGEIAGFADLDATGLLDRLFVSRTHQRQGVARALLAGLEAHARTLRLDKITTHASITALPFFERHGFVVQKKQGVTLRGELFTNYCMIKPLFYTT